MQDDIEALERFLFTLDWLMAVNERYPNQLQFGLVHVCFHGKQKLGQAYGARDAVQMLSDLSSKLRASFRKTDLVARDGTDFWILVPYTQPETVTEKVATLVEMASDNGLDIVDRDVAIFTMSNLESLARASFVSATDFLAHLKMNRQVALHWAQVFQPT